MRKVVAILCGLFLMTILAGCGGGGASIPSPPSDAKPGPPPGTTADLAKVKAKKQ